MLWFKNKLATAVRSSPTDMAGSDRVKEAKAMYVRRMWEVGRQL